MKWWQAKQKTNATMMKNIYMNISEVRNVEHSYTKQIHTVHKTPVLFRKHFASAPWNQYLTFVVSSVWASQRALGPLPPFVMLHNTTHQRWRPLGATSLGQQVTARETEKERYFFFFFFFRRWIRDWRALRSVFGLNTLKCKRLATVKYGIGFNGF